MFNEDGIGSSGVEERRRMTRKQHRTMSKAKSESEGVDRKTKDQEAMNTGECLNSAASGEGCEAGEEAMNTGECFNSASSGEGCEAKKEAMNTGECFNSASSGEGCEAKKVSMEEGELSNTERAFGKIVASEEFGDLRGLIYRCFGGFELEGLNDYRLIDERVKEGAYEQKPSLFASDLDKFLNKIQKLGADISTLARSLSDKTETTYQQLLAQDGCQHCKEMMANDTEFIVCDACEDMLHISCIQPSLKEIPIDNWYCNKCLVSSNRG